MSEQISCPADFVKINEAQPRLVAAQTLVIAALYVITHWWLLMLFLMIDFFLRAFKLGKYSLLSMVAKFFIQQFHIQGKLVDQAPKRFAAKLGFVFTAVILLFYLLNQIEISLCFTCLLMLFALLESAFSFCVGCIVYSFGVKTKLFRQ